MPTESGFLFGRRARPSDGGSKRELGTGPRLADGPKTLGQRFPFQTKSRRRRFARNSLVRSVARERARSLPIYRRFYNSKRDEFALRLARPVSSEAECLPTVPRQKEPRFPGSNPRLERVGGEGALPLLSPSTVFLLSAFLPPFPLFRPLSLLYSPIVSILLSFLLLSHVCGCSSSPSGDIEIGRRTRTKRPRYAAREKRNGLSRAQVSTRSPSLGEGGGGAGRGSEPGPRNPAREATDREHSCS